MIRSRERRPLDEEFERVYKVHIHVNCNLSLEVSDSDQARLLPVLEARA